MTPEQSARIEEVFHRVRALREAEREAAIRRECGEDEELADEVRTLLGKSAATSTETARASGALDRLARGIQSGVESHPARIGGFEILGVLGKGGMGVVYEARQDRPQRNVALKVVRPGLASAEALKRFELEAHVLARLQHPGIAQVYEVGTADIGAGPQPYFAMELVRGPNLRDYAESCQLGAKERLELMAKVCDAVQHAHQKGVIHRDLKPGNILVVEDVATGATQTSSLKRQSLTHRPRQGPQAFPKILDFGVARVTDSDIRVTTIQTDVGQLIGTIPYMSPEQVSADPSDLDTRSDVYALGVILYELLAGRLPYDIHKQLIHEAVRIIREDDPTPLSSAVARVARSGDSARPWCTVRDVRGDVETIVAKALEKDKTRRYQAASALAADIRRYLGNEPIAARPPSAMYQLSKFARRNRALVGGVVAVFVVLVVGVITSTTLYLRAEQQRVRAVSAEAEQSRAREEAVLERTRADQEAAGARARADELEQVAKFQEEQLSGIDAQTMGVRLRADLLNKARAAAERSKRSPQEIDARIAELERQIAGSDFTGMALNALDENVFQRALAAIERQFADQPLTDGTPAHGSKRKASFKGQPLVRARLLQTLAVTMQELGMVDAAGRPQEGALAIRRRVLGGEHPDTLDSINNMGLLLQSQGKLAEAEPYYREALEKSRRVLGEEHPETLTSINNMGFLLQAQGKLTEAESYWREASEKYRRVLGDEHRETLGSINNLGFLLQAQGRFAEAEPYWRETLKTRRRVLGDEHPDTLTSINNMGYLLQCQGRLTEAEAYYREALEKRRRVLGGEHPGTIASINNMGGLLQSLKRLSEAEPFWREALDKFRRVLGDQHPDTIASINNMGQLLQHQGKLAEAEPYLLEALQKSRRVLGDDHFRTLGSINNMGMLLRATGRLTDAEAYLREAMEKSHRVLGDDHPDTIRSISNMGFLMVSRGQLAEAVRFFREALEKSRHVLGDDHPDTVGTIGTLGLLLQLQREHTDAVTLLVPAEPAARRVFTGANTMRLGRFLTALGRSRAAIGEFDAAQANLTEAQAIVSEARDATAQHRAEVLTGLVELNVAWHAAEPGKGYDKKAAQWREKWQATTQSALSTQPSAIHRSEATTQPAAAVQHAATQPS